MATLVQLDRKACLRHCSSGQDAERADDDEHSKPFQAVVWVASVAKTDAQQRMPICHMVRVVAAPITCPIASLADEVVGQSARIWPCNRSYNRRRCLPACAHAPFPFHGPRN
eukprot:CAMPEP_0177364804 /NCGR_PEP_ID=MMETSP0368-20130122/38979_1 /TAXON_ID=447022 ORGANISM="Scrippsiella hangoei-like, Strain SHHI-4" /NCGR_SAMPLE_ID=MMETSP0368 /ASSEMBLY_ACC=CAM_ASM_000363 /LENGTH=111 /DNA_ID=CAMNT_0018827677 /DNA_START=490 /DNA_END=825 /DNA_ORIENTATION=-